MRNSPVPICADRAMIVILTGPTESNATYTTLKRGRWVAAAYSRQGLIRKQVNVNSCQARLPVDQDALCQAEANGPKSMHHFCPRLVRDPHLHGAVWQLRQRRSLPGQKPHNRRCISPFPVKACDRWFARRCPGYLHCRGWCPGTISAGELSEAPDCEAYRPTASYSERVR